MMRAALFYHSLMSDWNHGNAHFLRGVATELLARGHEVTIFEARDAWSVQNLVSDHGPRAVHEFARAYPWLKSTRYDLRTLDLDRALHQQDLVVVHEWNDPALVARIGAHRARSRGYRLLFHDTHHRAVTEPEEMAAYDLREYDGVLAFGSVVRDIYLDRCWTGRAWTWHEAADVRLFRPTVASSVESDLVWVGNWGDDERTAELQEFVFDPVHDLRLRGRVYGVRYPEEARDALRSSGIEYGGWLPNFRVPQVFASSRVTVHVPRRPYVESLPGIPTIRPFEALACGIPLICSPWEDSEGLFRAGEDYFVARDGRAMRSCLRAVLEDETVARGLAANGRQTILARHTCGHRVDELLSICVELGVDVRPGDAGMQRRAPRMMEGGV